MKNKKIINDPVYGFITIPFDIILELIDEPVFQRLRRVKQLGLTDYVYPGAVHTRFHHAIGALHLMVEALRTLQSKSVDITEEEIEAACIAILLHDIGHGPYSHALEHLLLPLSHEEIGLDIMNMLNKKYDGRLTLAISIFKNEYKKPYLHQLISGQLDMDRMDYLTRDSFFTGVAEGVIGYDRIIKMLNVSDGQLVIEEKGAYSIEKFLIARKLMYWQVYLHRAVLSSEIMLKEFWKRVKVLHSEGKKVNVCNNLLTLIDLGHKESDLNKRSKQLKAFCLLDDIDMMHCVKNNVYAEDLYLSILAKGLVNRKLFKLNFIEESQLSDRLNILRHNVETSQNRDKDVLDEMIFTGSETTNFYHKNKEEILMLKKDMGVEPYSSFSNFELNQESTEKHYLCYPNF